MSKTEDWQCVRCGRCCMHMHSDGTNMPCECLLIKDGIATCLIHGENKPDACKRYPNHPDFGGEPCFFERNATPCIALLESEPEPGEFTKNARLFLPPKEVFDQIDITEQSEQPGQLERLLYQACERIDRLTDEIAQLKEAVETAKRQMCQLCEDWPDPTDCDRYPCWRITIVEQALKGE